MRKILTVGALSAAAMIAGVAPALASTPADDVTTLPAGDIGALCDFGTYGDFSELCDPATLADAGKYLDLGTYGDYSWLLSPVG
ncbi:hypothetical protein [Amycolatopsis nigrescens]|uniref:hypothetical protein n=1 Tax=Amycolatopsis nigrescens TaxID=381445 RepID=UPI0012FA754D|nr:hypothetical protein [Amycolatopsis nigrescens]